MADNNASDTLEFLRIMGAEPAAPSKVPSVPAGRDLQDDDLPPLFDDAVFAGGATASPSEVTKVADPLPDEAEPEEPKPVVIKGGPRRVVRADGRQPETSDYVLGQQRFALSSGHAMFAPKKRRNKVRDALLAVVALLAVAAVFVVAMSCTNQSVEQDKRESLVGTTQYDGALSLTPADDGGYYTVFLVTSTTTDADTIGKLSDVVMCRTDKAVTTAMRVIVPANLYVAPNRYSDAALTLEQVLDSQSITRALQAIDDGLGIRLYNVVCCEQSVYDELASVMDGSVDAAAVDPSSFLGRVRTNLNLEDLVAFCGKVGALDQAAIPTVTAPTTELDVNGVVMAEGVPAAFQDTLRSASHYQVVGYDENGNPIIAQFDQNGHYAGTQYDENGNPLLDENGVPWGALRMADGSLYFNENGYLQFWGQRYDDRGNPVGTQYDESGNPILNEWGDPVGTQYTEDGSDYLYDWMGNILIVNG